MGGGGPSTTGVGMTAGTYLPWDGVQKRGIRCNRLGRRITVGLIGECDRTSDD